MKHPSRNQTPVRIRQRRQAVQTVPDIVNQQQQLPSRESSPGTPPLKSPVRLNSPRQRELWESYANVMRNKETDSKLHQKSVEAWNKFFNAEIKREMDIALELEKKQRNEIDQRLNKMRRRHISRPTPLKQSTLTTVQSTLTTVQQV